MTQIKLIDINPQMVIAFQEVFSDRPDVQVVQGDITAVQADVWVTPTNSMGHMSGGVDYAIKNALGMDIEFSIQNAIQSCYNGHLPVGRAVIVDSGRPNPRFVVATPSMVGENDNLIRTKNTALACAAAFQAIYYAEDKHGAQIETIAIPGLGSGTGRVPPMLCAELMRIGYTLFKRKRYESFDEMLSHLNEELGIIGQAKAANVGEQPSELPPLKELELTPEVAQQLAQGEQAMAIESGKEIAEAELAEEIAQEEALTAEGIDDVMPPPVKSTGNGKVSVVTKPIVDYIKDTPIGTPIV